ncbi:acyl-CoA dehydrogenase [Endozoicomonas montiporae]|uniref:Acyl-CoA dehydrogenase n=2 Tax=Endozoicomonas montiporae TaxID=1027273 RepID=A0A081N850_9GAMM|nr:acyl-CoA dehydrogenase family protein [Endozoicomonas montiporae]AMO55491.1 acyl-CoA dehydrogenase [Endozoicomonas montiporae CL-33]KEQ14623.1 acyl-CoA dehydrogenase [Endozoicomonas montiporae]
MEFAFTEEQEMIRDSAESFLQDHSSSAAVRAAMETESGYDPQLWTRISTEMVWPALTIPETFGGLGLGYVELTILLEEMGRNLLCSPFYSTVCLGVNSLLVAGSDAQKQQWLPSIAEGNLTATLAYTSANHWGLDSVQCLATAEGDGFVLSGRLKYVPDGHTAGLLIIACRDEGSLNDQGISLFAVPADTEGVKRRWTPAMDQTRRQAEITLDNVYVDRSALLGTEGQSGEKLKTILQLAAIGVAAEQCGGARQSLDMTVDYTKERVQFGRTIASFQAIKHRAADMMVQVECARSAVYYAACVAQEALFCNESGNNVIACELPEAASLAKAYCSDAFFHCAAESIQLHGGVGFTWEYDPHLYFKRAKSTETFLGDSAYHREAIAQVIFADSGMEQETLS